MFGRNKPLPIVKSNSENLDIFKIFKTIQGEGPLVGSPAIFVRLSGCNLTCKFCDTDFEDFNRKSYNQIIEEIKLLAKNQIKLIVITGGEPFRQNINPLCEKLLNYNFQVQIETNGSFYRTINPKVMIICSPKIFNKKYLIHPKMLDRIDYFKFLISNHLEDYQNIPNNFKNNNNIYLQAMDEYDINKNQANQKLCNDLAKKYNHRISIQLHKILNIE